MIASTHSRRTLSTTATFIALLLITAACTTRANQSTTVHAAASAATGSSPAVAAKTMLDAKGVLDKLTAAGLPLTHGAVQDENTDPNHLLGRPTGYLSRASFDLPDGDPDGEAADVARGGAIEVFADAAGARRRADYIEQSLKDSPILGTEYHYVHGPVLVRITGRVKPSVANRFGPVVDGLP